MIFRAFSGAYDSLKVAMVAQSMSGASHTSILGSIIGANFDEYTEQRFQLRQVFETSGRFEHYKSPPPPPPGNPLPLDGDRPPLPPGPPPGPPNYPQRPEMKQTGRQRQEMQQSIDARQAALPPRPPAPAPPIVPTSAPVAPSHDIGLANAKAKPVTIELTEDETQAPLPASQSASAAASESHLSQGRRTSLSSESLMDEDYLPADERNKHGGRVKPEPNPETKPSRISRRKSGRTNRPDYPPAEPAETADKSESESESGSESEGPSDPEVRRKMRKRKANLRRAQICQERAARVKQLRPDLRVPNSLSLRQARKLTGLETNAELEEDLSRREQQQSNGTA